MNFKIKAIACLVACATFLCLTTACTENPTDKNQGEAGNSNTNASNADTPAIEKVTTDFEDTKFGKYKYVWGDEFDKDELDLSKWRVQIHSLSANDRLVFENGDEELPNVFSVKDGMTTQKLIRWYDPTNTLIQYASSAGLMTRPTMSYQYGYLEARLKMTFKKDANAFWLVSTNALNENKNAYCKIEVDVFETLASTDSVTPNVHYWYADGRHTDYNGYVLKGNAQKYTFKESYNLANEFHVYGFEWTPTEMSMYVDGEKYWTIDTTKSFDNDPDISVYNQPMYLMVGCGAFTSGSTWHAYSGDIVDNNSLPLSCCTDYIRLYQDPNMKGTQLNLAK